MTQRHEQAGEEATASVMAEWPQLIAQVQADNSEMLQQQYGGPSPEIIDYIPFGERRVNVLTRCRLLR